MKNTAKIKTVLLVLSLFVLLAKYKDGSAATTYEGREEGAAWRQKALERIEKIRKAELVVEVVDKKGTPLLGAQVKVAMRRHAFGFGSALTAHNLTDDGEDGKRYREIVSRSFSKVVLENDLKWGPWEQGAKRIKGEFYNTDNTFIALKWLRERDIRVRGHYVAWGPLKGDSGTTSNAEKFGLKFRDALIGHAEEKVRQVDGLVAEWDVVNHPLGWEQKNIRDVAGSDIYDTMFRKVIEWNPKAVRYINEGGILNDSGRKKQNSEYYQLIEGMLKRGVPVQGIGFMGHFFAEKDLTPPQKLLEILDRYATLGLPLQVTEFDVRYGNEMGESVTLTEEQERLQADYTRDFLIAMFSHPAMEGVVMWGFWEGAHWYPSAALYRKDWTIKPNGRVWENLVLKQWWTTVNGETDAKGRFVTRGYLGEYAIEATYKGKRGVVQNISLDRSGARTRVVIE